RTPCAPSATSVTAAPSVRIENMMSASRAAAAGVSARRMPCATSASALLLVRFQPTTSWPAAINRGTINDPMAPRPANPSFIPASSLSLCFNCFADGACRAAHNQIHGKDDMSRLRLRSLDEIDDQLRGLETRLVMLNAHRGQ